MAAVPVVLLLFWLVTPSLSRSPSSDPKFVLNTVLELLGMETLSDDISQATGGLNATSAEGESTSNQTIISGILQQLAEKADEQVASFVERARNANATFQTNGTMQALERQAQDVNQTEMMAEVRNRVGDAREEVSNALPTENETSPILQQFRENVDGDEKMVSLQERVDHIKEHSANETSAILHQLLEKVNADEKMASLQERVDRFKESSANALSSSNEASAILQQLREKVDVDEKRRIKEEASNALPSANEKSAVLQQLREKINADDNTESLQERVDRIKRASNVDDFNMKAFLDRMKGSSKRTNEIYASAD